MTSPTPHSDGFYASVAYMAETARQVIIALTNGERLQYVQRRVTESEIVFGVWPDPGEMGGFGFHLIKGRGHLAALSGAKLPDKLTTTAIPCVGPDQAIAAEHVWGAPDQNEKNTLEAPPQKKRKKAKSAAQKRHTPKASALALKGPSENIRSQRPRSARRRIPQTKAGEYMKPEK